MANNRFIYRLSVLSLATLLGISACGGGSDNNPPAPRPVPPSGTAIPAKLLTGKLVATDDNCQQVDGPAADARYTYLLSATVKKNRALYLTESWEMCNNYSAGAEQNLRIRKVENGRVSTYLAFPQSFIALSRPTTTAILQYPSAVHVADNGDTWVTGFMAARSFEEYLVDESAIPGLSGTGYQYVPGLYHYPADKRPPIGDILATALVAGTFVPDAQPLPAVVDGQGATAQFYAPHDMEVDASGRMYVIDDYRIRTIDAAYNVQTLDLTARYGIVPRNANSKLTALALHTDLNGNVHALLSGTGSGAESSYTWLNLSTGKHVSFKPLVSTDLAITGRPFYVNHSIVAIGDALIASSGGALFKIMSDGTVERLTGDGQAPTDENHAPLQDITQTHFQRIQHLEYTADDTLYIVLPQGVVTVENFRQRLKV